MFHVAHTWESGRSFTAELLIEFEWDKYVPQDRDGSLPQGGFRGVERIKVESISFWQESVIVSVDADALPEWLKAEVVAQFMIAMSEGDLEDICRTQVEAEDEEADA